MSPRNYRGKNVKIATGLYRGLNVDHVDIFYTPSGYSVCLKRGFNIEKKPCPYNHTKLVAEKLSRKGALERGEDEAQQRGLALLLIEENDSRSTKTRRGICHPKGWRHRKS